MTILDKITQSEMVGVGLWTVFVVFLGYKAWQAWFRRKAGLAKKGIPLMRLSSLSVTQRLLQ